MTNQDVVGKLVAILNPLAEGRVANINENTELTGELALDSLKVMDLLMAVEDEFDVSVPINMLADVKTVGDLAVQIQRAAGQNA